MDFTMTREDVDDFHGHCAVISPRPRAVRNRSICKTKFADPRREELLAQRVAKMRRKFASQYGFVVPEIKLTDDLAIPPQTYQIKIHGTVAASETLRIGDVLVITGDGPKPDVPGEEAREPAFGMKAMWVPEMFAANLKREGFKPVAAR